MKLVQAMGLFRSFEQRKNAYRTRDIGRLLGEDGEKLRSSLRRLEEAGILRRVAYGLYWHEPVQRIGYDPIDEIASMLRAGEVSFIGLESAAARWGVISQMPVDRLTVITTGREGEFSTPFGTVEFVHTKASVYEIACNTVCMPGGPLRLATKRYTVEGLKRTRRSLDLIDWDEVEEDDA